ncbi:sugar O-acyltransferase, sialic acid O-acetyltransferase NeuD family [Hymenobacter gelipurpurascens]|uniref:Sugar O-acyltransferase, sialic acid O-acetyltransferase NeuD family n=1 Tax=Hymenobacter gelipurpurascens TaxID=89968 RepID=A0A212TEM2_9BACT|nr:NeuD/PglB/VioB family sugar acetyltransferase [Hymenobacter gelipurpurascens]SNC64284.1 sugar O-acyltransferase, sialic acid O-acetyltransferase NeuD family [Hymenobacter gelipurpurascens]
MENPVIILGAQAVGTAALDAFQSNDVVIYCLLDDDAKLQNTELNDVPVMGNTDDKELLKLLGKKCEVFVATEDTASRRSLTNMLREEYEVAPVNSIHQRASVSPHAWLGHGILVGPNAVVASTAKLGDGCIIGANAVVDGKVEVGDYAQLGAGAILNAEVSVGELAFIGAGAVVVAGVKIGAKARVGAGSVVVADVPANQTVFGNPAQKV